MKGVGGSEKACSRDGHPEALVKTRMRKVFESWTLYPIPNPKPNTGNPDSNPTLSGRLRLDILQLHKTEEPNYKPCIELYLAHPRPSRGIFLDTCAQNDPIIFRYSGLG